MREEVLFFVKFKEQKKLGDEMVHCFTQLGNNVVVDVYSGAVHIMDEPAFALTRYYEEQGFEQDGLSKKTRGALDGFSHEDLEEAYSEVSQLVKEGMLFTKDYYEAMAAKQKKSSVVKALCLHIAHDCNLRCKYCFADEGAFKGERQLMSVEVGKAAIDFLIAKSGSRCNLEVDFFGGEPLMNFDVVKEIVEYARSIEKGRNKNFRFTITTNGVLLSPDKMDYINKNMSNVVLSIDGRKCVNDAMRPTAGGGGTYDTIVPKFQEMARRRDQDNYYVRGTFTRKNLDFSKDVLHLADLGFQQTSVEPVVAPDEADYALRQEDLPEIFAQYDALAEEYVKRKKEGRGFSFFHFMVDLDQGPCVIKRLKGCGSGSEYLAVTPNGDIYPCHQFAGEPQFKMGNVFDGELDGAIKDVFESSNVYTKEECRGCWAKFYCSGGCPANAWQFNGDFNKPHELGCQMQRQGIAWALGIKAGRL